jgi:hypothetical protein
MSYLVDIYGIQYNDPFVFVPDPRPTGWFLTEAAARAAIAYENYPERWEVVYETAYSTAEAYRNYE